MSLLPVHYCRLSPMHSTSALQQISPLRVVPAEFGHLEWILNLVTSIQVPWEICETQLSLLEELGSDAVLDHDLDLIPQAAFHPPGCHLDHGILTRNDKGAVGNSSESLTKGKVKNSHCSFPIHKSWHFTTEGMINPWQIHPDCAQPLSCHWHAQKCVPKGLFPQGLKQEAPSSNPMACPLACSEDIDVSTKETPPQFI